MSFFASIHQDHIVGIVVALRHFDALTPLICRQVSSIWKTKNSVTVRRALSEVSVYRANSWTGAVGREKFLELRTMIRASERFSHASRGTLRIWTARVDYLSSHATEIMVYIVKSTGRRVVYP